MSESKLKWQLMDSTAAPISHATSDTRCIVVDDETRPLIAGKSVEEISVAEADWFKCLPPRRAEPGEGLFTLSPYGTTWSPRSCRVVQGRAVVLDITTIGEVAEGTEVLCEPAGKRGFWISARVSRQAA